MAHRKIPAVVRSSRSCRVSSPQYVRIARGWYAKRTDIEGASSQYAYQARILAAKISAFSQSAQPIVIRGQAAAFLHGLSLLYEPTYIDFSGRESQGHRCPFGRRGPSVRWQGELAGNLVTLRRAGIEFSSLEQIVADVAAFERGEEAVVAMSSALRAITGAAHHPRGDVGVELRSEEVKAWALAWISKQYGRGRVRRARRLLALASPWHETVPEARLRWFLAYWGFPQPKEQFRLGRRYVDLAYDEWKIAIEFDGYVKIATNATEMGDILRRDEELNAYGWKVLHVTWKDFSNPEALAHRLAAAFPARAHIELGRRPRYA